MILTARVAAEQAGMRLDDGAKAIFPQLSKGEIRRVIDWGGCNINQSLVRVASRALKEGDEIALGIMEPERCIELVYAKGDLLYEDRDFLAVLKASGFNSQRTPYQLKGTVEYAVDCYLRSIGLTEPARVVHRLDRGTSGVMFWPKHKKAATLISNLLKEGKVSKTYWALISGSPDQEQWEVDAPIAKLSKFRYGVALPGRSARTLFRVFGEGNGVTAIEARPLTGRTHQIRVHLTHSGFPIVGDEPYGGVPAARMMLHCRSMSFTTPNGKFIEAVAPPDPSFAAAAPADLLQ
ncbi:RluA family pseudouridine synthase [Geomesophilobacter sediminis]|uniref:RluA family pseudouridine synthase n=1 Tax=Geomesophilobacter sediminis TaxID=2798584 RepID=A0A8J7JDU7_9BACT|nr:RluA family pseudouridine synthase [Geomesophilobacter sediminis]MBJ6725438.1 RluA family pseudouridine synthase [Geomesophilobacter sediminis]